MVLNWGEVNQQARKMRDVRIKERIKVALGTKINNNEIKARE